MRFPVQLIVFALVVVIVEIAANAEESWPQFRGAAGDGVTAATGLPTRWTKDSNVLWKAAVPGKGCSSPVHDGNTIWLTAAVEVPLTGKELAEYRQTKLKGNPLASQMKVIKEVRMLLLSYDAAKGEKQSELELFTAAHPEPVHELNSYATPTPHLVNGVLYCHFGQYGTCAVDAKTGKPIWKKSIPTKESVGPGSSPLVYEDVMIIPFDGVDSQYILGLDVKTGEERWKTMRPSMEGSEGESHKAFCTPLLATNNGEPQIIIPGAQWIVSYHPRTGEEIWKMRHGKGFSVVPRPVVASGRVFFSTGYMGPVLVALPIDRTGDITSKGPLWSSSKQIPTMPSPVVAGGVIYVVSDGGVATAFDTENGKLLWTKRLGGKFTSSPMLTGDGNIYVSNVEGVTTVFKASRKYEEVGKNDLDAAHRASPAVLGTSLILRVDGSLYRIGS